MLVFKSKSDTSKDCTANDQATFPEGAGSSSRNFDTSPVWEKIAKSYDKEIDWDELIMGIGVMRRFLVGQAKGDVLEVSTGTGRNFDYYKADQMDSARFTDRNAGMLAEAESKFDKFKDQFRKTFVEFRQANVNEQPAGRFDTVVDTFGLCSCGDPEEALISLADACKPSEDSRILLLEHGRSHYDWLNRLLDSNVDKHVMKWGCWWNRDLMGLFEQEKVKEKLEIVKVHRFHLGTTCYIVAKPKLQTVPSPEDGTVHNNKE
ncbi:S-adenosyl-L-methionine-dependent methyltransferase [Zychaea mexicana]|uniref:S-adenosyl-L-methionine-dependent methyltransferase n=1 Tax=Zychaea mexicana TaxID=64656 RepID=UPI0022FE597E|nr:S-adenosyl-L-methionine-dependent methyltransferase [Zychaea mexicana]KAI9496444.1 S-adenosyl-L-methionine-dependent methyltransferase [Zychaea mexicana]